MARINKAKLEKYYKESVCDERKCYLDFQERANLVRASAEPLLEKHFGERCEDYSHGCENCRRWQLLDDLLKSPYDNPS